MIAIVSVARHSSAFLSWVEERQQEPGVTRCIIDGCSWEFRGTLAAGRASHQEHRESAHPGFVAVRRNRRMKGGKNRKGWNGKEGDEVEVEEVVP